MCDEAMRDRLGPALSQAQFFFPNEGQLAEMTGTEDPAEGVARLRDATGVETVIGTLGGEGSLILGPGGEAKVPAFDIDVVDTTGCGDAYVAGFIVATANGWDAEAAGWLGAAASGLVATGLGSDSGIVDLLDPGVHGDPGPRAHRRPRPGVTKGCGHLVDGPKTPLCREFRPRASGRGGGVQS